jgi:hypothetical protein
MINHCGDDYKVIHDTCTKLTSSLILGFLPVAKFRVDIIQNYIRNTIPFMRDKMKAYRILVEKPE